MRIEQLNYLLHIAGSGSISRSAQALNISQQGLSQSIHQLERELDAKLLYREGNSTKLTAVGKLLQEDIETILRSCDNIRSIVAANAGADEGGEQFCRLCVTPHFCISVLPNIMQRMNRLFPRLHMSVTETEIRKLVQSYELDFDADVLYLLTCPERFCGEILRRAGVQDFRVLSALEIHAVVASDHPLASHELITVDDLCSYPLALLGSDIHFLRYLMGDRCDQAQIRLHTTNFDLYQSAARMKDVISMVIPLAYDRQFSTDFRLIPLEKTETILFGYIVNRYAQESPIAKELLNMAQSEVRKMEQALSVHFPRVSKQ